MPPKKPPVGAAKPKPTPTAPAKKPLANSATQKPKSVSNVKSQSANNKTPANQKTSENSKNGAGKDEKKVEVKKWTAEDEAAR